MKKSNQTPHEILQKIQATKEAIKAGAADYYLFEDEPFCLKHRRFKRINELLQRAGAGRANSEAHKEANKNKKQ